MGIKIVAGLQPPRDPSMGIKKSCAVPHAMGEHVLQGARALKIHSVVKKRMKKMRKPPKSSINLQEQDQPQTTPVLLHLSKHRSSTNRMLVRRSPS